MALSKDTVLRAWKDEEFRNNLSAEEQGELPACPTSVDGSQLTDSQLESAAGGSTPLCVAVTIAGAGYAAGSIFD